MSKIELITLHRVKNYGSVLQAYATQTILNNLGYEVEIIDYYPKRYTKRGMLSRIKKQNKLLEKNVIFRIAARIIIYPSYIIRFKTFNKFLKKYLVLSPLTYKDDIELANNLPNGDIFMTGSDQVWNSEWNGGIDNCLFLNVPNINNKIAYASSFGKSKLDDTEKEITRKLLKDYKHISLRETSGVKICEDLGIKDTVNVLDPTLLLDSKEWEKMASNKYDGQNYILTYNLNRNSKIDNYAKNLSEKTGLKVKYLSYQLHDIFKNGKMYCNPCVEDFLSLIKNATYIITDSFHATAFSINFKRDFIIVYPGKYSTRLQSILEILNLEDRVAKDENDLDITLKKINYSDVYKKLKVERNKSVDWLRKNLKK